MDHYPIRMDKYAHRRERLRSLLELRHGGKIAPFARETGIDPSYVSRMLYEESKRGFKRIGEDIIELIEGKLAIPGYFASTLYLKPIERYSEAKNELSVEAAKLIKAIEAADISGVVASPVWKRVADLVAELAGGKKAAAGDLPLLSERQRVLTDLYRDSLHAGDTDAAATLQRLLEADAKKQRKEAGKPGKRAARR